MLPVPTREIACSRCGAINRIGAYGVTKLPHCGKCRSGLPEAVGKRLLRQAYTMRYFIMIAVGLGLLAILKPSVLKDLIPDGSTTKISAPSATCTSYPQPSSGVSPLIIRTSTGGSYFIKLEDAVTAKPIMTFYLRGGETFEQHVPEGTFVLKYATGEIWCGEKGLFGPSTSTNKADRIFEFTETRGYTVELIFRRNGNLRTNALDRSQF